MNTKFLNPIPGISLIFLWLAYALLGWHLSAHHIFWFVGAFVTIVVLAVIRKSISWVESLMNVRSQLLSLILVLSASIGLIASWSIIFELFLLPLTATVLADLEMRISGFSPLDSFLVLTILAAFGLAVGETIDILFLPSLRY
ncbi:MAG TPA: hypothetical protein DDW76_20465 [Cyanobacteria bacterium UBA11369]|nr:hypothetical protein [Cyanobacteria bacterium UBA11371]HBE34237.1 hypothetical protein [Cyanobacteria bacterium UBA11368]HBE51084.1 hypothetical protein [Cyanobacteria bacterium UBA11369]